MRTLVSMREALSSPAYFGEYLKGDTWAAWRVLLIAIMGEPLTEAERAIFKSLTGRECEPKERLREFWGIIGRRGGKSRAMAVLASYLAACCDHRDVLAPGERGVLPILAATTKQAQQFFNFVSGIFAEVPRFKGLVREAMSDTLRLKTGVDITVSPASWRTIRSITAISAIGDEVAFWRSDDAANPDEEVVAALKPALLTTGGMWIAISSPYARRGEMFKAWRKNFGPKGDPRRLVVKAASLTLNPSLPKAEIDEAYAEDAAKASAEYGGEFRNDIEQYVSRDVLERAVPIGVAERAPQAGVTYRAFVDPSGGASDSMTLAISHQEGTRGILDAVRERKAPFSPESVVEEFAALLKRYGLRRVTGDRYAGEWPREAFGRHGIAYLLSEFPKSAIYLDFLPRLNSGEAQLLDIPALVNQLGALERRTARGGRDSIDHSPGAHDDVANAAAGALAGRWFKEPAAAFGTYGSIEPVSLYASRPASYWAARGQYHPSDKQSWMAKGVLAPDGSVKQEIIEEAKAQAAKRINQSNAYFYGDYSQ